MEFHKLSRFPPSVQPFNYLLCCILYKCVNHIATQLRYSRMCCVHTPSGQASSEKANMFVVIDLNGIFNGRLLQVWWQKFIPMHAIYTHIRTRTRHHMYVNMMKIMMKVKRNSHHKRLYMPDLHSPSMPEQFSSTNCQWSTLQLSFR